MKYVRTLFVVLIVSLLACSSNEYVTIPDANLAAVVREALDLAPTDAIPRKKLEVLPQLDADSRNIRDLTGLEKRKRVRDLRTPSESNYGH